MDVDPAIYHKLTPGHNKRPRSFRLDEFGFGIGTKSYFAVKLTAIPIFNEFLPNSKLLSRRIVRVPSKSTMNF